MNSNQFREELKKLLPGYKWTVKRQPPWKKKEDMYKWMEAEGIITAGLNRISTIRVYRNQKDDGGAVYTVKSAGFGAKSGWGGEMKGKTFARAVRGLQELYEIRASNYATLAGDIQNARPEKVRKLRRTSS